MKIEFEGATIADIADQVERFWLALRVTRSNANVLSREETMGVEWNCESEDVDVG